MSDVRRPAVFIGSSTSGIDFARAIRGHLEKTPAEVTIWDEGFFSPGRTLIETLVSESSRFDFAILVLTPDDVIQSTNVSTLGPRDNVIFELGLFMGRLGRERTFAVHQSDAKIPTDLSGVTLAEFHWPRMDGRHSGAVGAASDLIMNEIRRLGERSTAQIQEVAREQQRQAGELDVMKFMLRLVIPRYERMHLVGLARDDETFMVEIIPPNSSAIFQSELQHLASLQLVEIREKKELGDLFKSKVKCRRDLKEYLRITPRGKEYLDVYQNWVGELGP
jgi:hypothetical protein